MENAKGNCWNKLVNAWKELEEEAGEMGRGQSPKVASHVREFELYLKDNQ